MTSIGPVLRQEVLGIVHEVLLIHVCHPIPHGWRTLRALRARSTDVALLGRCLLLLLLLHMLLMLLRMLLCMLLLLHLDRVTLLLRHALSPHHQLRLRCRDLHTLLLLLLL